MPKAEIFWIWVVYKTSVSNIYFSKHKGGKIEKLFTLLVRYNMEIAHVATA